MQLLSDSELVQLVRSVFPVLPNDEYLTILVDIPNNPQNDFQDWKKRRHMAYDWYTKLNANTQALNLQGVRLCAYASVDSNNADLPRFGYIYDKAVPNISNELLGDKWRFETIFNNTQLFLAPTQFSTTAPLKVAAKRYAFRAATMPGFSEKMIPALRIDYEKVNERCQKMKEKLDAATGAYVKFKTKENEYDIFFDLRFRLGHASGGRFPQPGTAGNLPSGETYIVPYEGEKGQVSKTEGDLPVQFENEIVVFEIRNNRAVGVRSSGLHSQNQAEYLQREPAYGNMAELGFGILSDFGLEPIGQILLDEKLGFHIAFGRSDHFGGAVGPGNFSSAKEVVHIDRIYIPQTQSTIRIQHIDLEFETGKERIMEEDNYLIFS